jgi:hypothetical protein
VTPVVCYRACFGNEEKGRRGLAKANSTGRTIGSTSRKRRDAPTTATICELIEHSPSVVDHVSRSGSVQESAQYWIVEAANRMAESLVGCLQKSNQFEMARILISSQDVKFSESLAQSLRTHRHEVSVRQISPGDLREIERHTNSYDILVLDVTGLDHGATRKLIVAGSECSLPGTMPIVLCISRIYKGARFEFDLERQGSRLIYVR